LSPKPVIAQDGIRAEIRGRMGLEAKKREVQQLLKDYRAYHTPYGGARELNLEPMGASTVGRSRAPRRLEGALKWL
jgi:hypothetical protein